MGSPHENTQQGKSYLLNTILGLNVVHWMAIQYFVRILNYILIQSANYTEQSSSWQANRSSGSWDFSFYGTWRFINVFTAAHHLSTSWATWIHSTASLPVSIHFSLLSHLDILDGLFPWVFQNRMFHAFLFTFMHATCPTYLILLYLIIVIMSG